MESFSNLNASLPFNIEDDGELMDLFKESALSISSLFKHAQKARKAAVVRGYEACVSDFLNYISNVRANDPDKPVTIGHILDHLESRQAQLIRDLDVKPTVPKQQKQSPPPAITRRKSPTSKPSSPRPNRTFSQTRSPPRLPRWSSPSLSPAPSRPEPAWNEPKPTSVWPEVSVLSVLPTTTPNVGSKRKRDALVEVDQKTVLNLHHPNSKRRKGKSGGHHFSISATIDDRMDVDDESREKKRVHRR